MDRLDLNPGSSEVVLTPQALFTPPGTTETRTLARCQRNQWRIAEHASICLDRFVDDAVPDTEQVACCFLRLLPGGSCTVRFTLYGSYQLSVCASGGWLLKPAETSAPSYWLPRLPLQRTLDRQGHVLTEVPAPVVGLDLSAETLSIAWQRADNQILDGILWHFPASAHALVTALEQPHALERQPLFLWGSKTLVQSPADLYLHLIHGQVYANDFVYPRKWKFSSEHDAHGLYVAFDGLAQATGKPLYRLLTQQILHSVIAHQCAEGNWRNGEWTDLMESHYRSHNGAMLLLENALQTQPDDAVQQALARAVGYAVAHADQTDIGLWFLHDSLEESAAAMDTMLAQTGTRWIPSRALGKSPCNKFILNTHLDASVAVDRYAALTGDQQYAAPLASARAATRATLALRPANMLYRTLYRAVWLTLLPTTQAERLPLLLRLLKRLTWMQLIPRLHRVKQRFPRMVMPGGLIERHLSSLHFGTHYHAVNLMDLARYRRRFPDDAIDDVIRDAIAAGVRLLDHWGESKNRRFAIVVWADALYHLYTQEPTPETRRLLADAMLRIAALKLGQPPSLLGGDLEAVRPEHRVSCPSPLDGRLRVANLSCNGRAEFIVVNPTKAAIPCTWRTPPQSIVWTSGDNAASVADVPPGGWLWGRAVG